MYLLSGCVGVPAVRPAYTTGHFCLALSCLLDVGNESHLAALANLIAPRAGHTLPLTKERLTLQIPAGFPTKNAASITVWTRNCRSCLCCGHIYADGQNPRCRSKISRSAVHNLEQRGGNGGSKREESEIIVVADQISTGTPYFRSQMYIHMMLRIRLPPIQPWLSRWNDKCEMYITHVRACSFGRGSS